jgi:hypothetical protein
MIELWYHSMTLTHIDTFRFDILNRNLNYNQNLFCTRRFAVLELIYYLLMKEFILTFKMQRKMESCIF